MATEIREPEPVPGWADYVADLWGSDEYAEYMEQ